MDKIEKKFFYILKTIGLLILLLSFQLTPILFLNIDLEKITLTQKIIYLITTDIILIGIFILIYKKDIKKDFKNYFNQDIATNLKTSIKYWIIGLILMIIANYIILVLTNNAVSQNEEAVRDLIDKVPLFMIFESLIFAPITEEIIFRKSIKDITNHKLLYPLISGLSFGLVHVITSYTNYQELLFIIPYSVVGFTFAKCYQKTDNIFSTITAHALHNSLTLIIYILSKIV